MEPSLEKWLSVKPGFDQIDADDVALLGEFAVLWSLFECRALATKGSAAKIVQWSAKPKVTPDAAESLSAALTYFRARYVEAGQPTQKFVGLRFRDWDHLADVWNMLTAESHPKDAELLGGLLLICWRFRNNFFHGEKAGYFFSEQNDNFLWANMILRCAMDLNWPIQSVE